MSFGDGATGNGEITTHAYSLPGNYEVKLKVTDNRGSSDTDESTAVIVVPNHPPSIPVIIGPSEGITNINYSFSVYSTDEDLDNIQYTIYWGDGNVTISDFMASGVLFNSTHMWSKSGNYNIVVNADDGQAIVTGNKTIIIKNPEPVILESNNFLLLLLGLLALIILILFLLLAKRQRDKEEEEENKKKNKKKKK